MALASTVFSKEEVNWIVFHYLLVIPDDRVTNASEKVAILALLRDQGLPEEIIPELECDARGGYTVTLRG